MIFITRKYRLLLTVVLAVGSVCWLSCGGDDNPSSGDNSGGNNNSGGNTTHTHTWGAWVVTTAATCAAPGVETRTCTQDTSHKETRPVAQLTGAVCETAHVHTWGAWVVTTAATCAAPGVETRTCTQDTSHKETRPVAQLTGAACVHIHTWGDWVVTTAATCAAPGVETRTCTQDASHKETRPVAALTGAVCKIDPSTVVSGTVTDLGGQSYKTVTIGTQTWMAENLNYASDSSLCYKNSPAYCEEYGRHYSWGAAKRACESMGWRLPTTDDWTLLLKSVGGGGTVLKSKTGWNPYTGVLNSNGTDIYGFTALPGGTVGSSSGITMSTAAGTFGYYWADPYGYYFGMTPADDTVISNGGGGVYASVRCVK